MSTGTPPPDLPTRLRRALHAAADLAAQIERGQGDGPLTRHVAELAQDAQNGPFRLVVLGLDPDSRGRALALLSGHDLRVFSLQIPDEVGLLDVRFGARGYALESAQGRVEFDRLEPFLAAVKQADLVRDGDPGSFLAPLTLQLQGPPGLQGLHVRMPENLRALRKNPRLLGRLAAHSHLLLVAGPPESGLPADDRQALRELCEAIPVVLPVVFAEALPPTHFARDRSLLPARELLPAHAAKGPEEAPLCCRDPQDPLRQAVGIAFHTSRLRTAAVMLKNELSEDRGQVDARSKALVREQKALEEGQRSRDLRSQVEALRQPVQDQLRQLGDALAEDLRAASIAGGPVEASVVGAVTQLGDADLEREPLGAKVRLLVRGEALERCRRALYEQLARTGKSAAVLLREGAGALEATLTRSLGALRQATVGVRLPSYDEERVRGAIKELLQSDLEGKAEIDRRGFWKRLAHGRQLVFTILMSVSLFGSVLPIGRMQILSAEILMPLFLGGVLMTIWSFRREDRERVDRELEKMRDTLRNQLTRRGSDCLRELGERTRRHLDDLKEQIGRQVEAVARETEQMLIGKGREDLKELAARAKVQEQRRRDLDALLQRCGELERMVADLERDSQAAVQQVVRGATSAKTGGKP